MAADFSIFERFKRKGRQNDECLSMYIINTIPHGKCFVRYLRTRCFCIRNLTRSLRSLVRFLIRQQLVRKYRTPALSMKYSIYVSWAWRYIIWKTHSYSFHHLPSEWQEAAVFCSSVTIKFYIWLLKIKGATLQRKLVVLVQGSGQIYDITIPGEINSMTKVQVYNYNNIWKSQWRRTIFQFMVEFL